MKMDNSFLLAIFPVQVLLVLGNSCNVKLNAKLSPPDLIKACGYPSEVHNIAATEDGYILQTHRIANPGKQPVILMHGVLDSSIAWVMTGPKHALGFVLYEKKYDVWLLNARGNDYSTEHMKYHRNGTERERKKYWNFSWHEIGKYDLAASIDYVLKNTSFSKIHFIGHSQGTTSFFVLTSERPEYNDKILLMVAMAPPIFMTHVKNVFFRQLSRHLSVIEALNDWIGLDDKWRDLNNVLIELPNTIFCTWDAIRNTQLCNNNFSPFAGNTSNHISKSIIPILNARIPSGVSVKSLLHHGQLIHKPRFRQYDYGTENNRKIYKRSTPPDYSLKNCTVSVAIIYSDHDTLVAARDVRRLTNELPNVMAAHRVDDDTFNHLDFILANDAKELVYDYIIDWMNIKEQRQSDTDR